MSWIPSIALLITSLLFHFCCIWGKAEEARIHRSNFITVLQTLVSDTVAFFLK